MLFSALHIFPICPHCQVYISDAGMCKRVCFNVCAVKTSENNRNYIKVMDQTLGTHSFPTMFSDVFGKCTENQSVAKT